MVNSDGTGCQSGGGRDQIKTPRFLDLWWGGLRPPHPGPGGQHTQKRICSLGINIWVFRDPEIRHGGQASSE
jgi:hypothetical protein